MWCASLGIRPQTTQGCVATYLQCILSRSRMVFGVTRRRRFRAPSETSGVGVGHSMDSAIACASSVPWGLALSGARLDSSSTDLSNASTVATFSRKIASRRSASELVSVFLAGRFLWTQSAASSDDRSRSRSATNWSRSAAESSALSVILSGRGDASLGARAALIASADSAAAARNVAAGGAMDFAFAPGREPGADRSFASGLSPPPGFLHLLVGVHPSPTHWRPCRSPSSLTVRPSLARPLG